MKEFIEFIFSKLFWKHLFRIIGITVGLLLIVFTWLRIYTHHSQAISVPDYYGMSVKEVEKATKEKKLRFQVVDSVYVTSAKKGVILDQNPPPNFKVKKYRTIFLTMNAINPEKIKMPNVTGISVREASAVLVSRGLAVGRLMYQPDIAMNYVLKQMSHGKEVSEGSMIIKGSKVDLVLGNGLSEKTINVPSFVGMRLYEAEKLMLDYYLNQGAVIFDNTVLTAEDSTNARVFKQRPEINTGINLGAPVDIWLTVALSKVPGMDTTANDTDDNK